jgi:hypothetical protein
LFSLFLGSSIAELEELPRSWCNVDDAGTLTPEVLHVPSGTGGPFVDPTIPLVES